MKTSQCPVCSRRFKISDDLHGKKVKCQCGHVFILDSTNFVSQQTEVTTDGASEPLASQSSGQTLAPTDWNKKKKTDAALKQARKQARKKARKQLRRNKESFLTPQDWKYIRVVVGVFLLVGFFVGGIRGALVLTALSVFVLAIKIFIAWLFEE